MERSLGVFEHAAFAAGTRGWQRRLLPVGVSLWQAEGIPWRLSIYSMWQAASVYLDSGAFLEYVEGKELPAVRR